MARTNVYLPDELHDTVRKELPDLNMSQVVRAALVQLLDCQHDRLACADCATSIERREVIDAPLGKFYRDVMIKLEDLVAAGGTAEGAARMLKRVGESHRVTAVAGIPLPRKTRAERTAHKVREMFPEEHHAKTTNRIKRATA